MKKAFTLLLLLLTVSSYAQKAKLELNLQNDSTYYLTMNAKLDIDPEHSPGRQNNYQR